MHDNNSIILFLSKMGEPLVNEMAMLVHKIFLKLTFDLPSLAVAVAVAVLIDLKIKLSLRKKSLSLIDRIEMRR